MGAWIEICYPVCKARDKVVAPLVGAWIEIPSSSLFASSLLSLLSWERGLKLHPVSPVSSLCLSLLSWERGLKFCPVPKRFDYILSLLSWERGLKSSTLYIVCFSKRVAPLVGAWIEIVVADIAHKSVPASLLSWERGLKFRHSTVLCIH